MPSQKRAAPGVDVEDAAESERLARRPKVESSDKDSQDSKPETYEFPYPSKNKVTTPVPFQQPSTLLTFSYTPERVLEFTDSALRYYVEPPLRAELKYGYERWIKKPEEKGRLDGLLKAVLKYRSRVDAGGGDGVAWFEGRCCHLMACVMTK
ncbi:uncharacterized protein PHACADRAFT_193730 [Phanerochaete carnosa HHB-10118-sp]|uniref:RAI1-like domain-containing protein n=1 Tax=Phanerochaete carnosa (strain HHB-10118-sp) TaxID=650164 RepID=K5W3X7_PHACS|nr:uncharacterized protein PHACADRAFT_193730 [Phanerochaete carnosa HHB-10118-sp]EKM58598.1 hypothetical protein PHACADRAFT_193730 [Phanerochaete carnosa HHB-10118-sp]